jgi:hypothetical protein
MLPWLIDADKDHFLDEGRLVNGGTADYDGIPMGTVVQIRTYREA